MFKEKLDLNMIGYVTFKQGDIIIGRFKNAIQPPAFEVVAKALIQNASAVIDVIELYEAGVLVCSRPIVNRSILNPDEVEFDALFDELSFNSHIDEARLKASVIGYFSIVEGIDIIKDSTQSIMVSWTIQIV